MDITIWSNGISPQQNIYFFPPCPLSKKVCCIFHVFIIIVVIILTTNLCNAFQKNILGNCLNAEPGRFLRNNNKHGILVYISQLSFTSMATQYVCECGRDSSPSFKFNSCILWSSFLLLNVNSPRRLKTENYLAAIYYEYSISCRCMGIAICYGACASLQCNYPGGIRILESWRNILVIPNGIDFVRGYEIAEIFFSKEFSFWAIFGLWCEKMSSCLFVRWLNNVK